MSTSNLLWDFAITHQISVESFKRCATQTGQVIEKIKSLYAEPPFSIDEDMVVFGSIARNEAMDGSDVDWPLLIDGQANPSHASWIASVRKKLKENDFPDSGTSGMFGHISFSHELIHNIGGQSDTNHNLTKRILLLLESHCISFSGAKNTSTAYDRIIKGILSQYIEHDSGLNSDRDAVPRFLLNDFVRFWRTMCVDFAYKQKEQEGEKWVLRNIKLRISRKMLFVKGLLMCLSHSGKYQQNKADLIVSLSEMVRLTPIELLISIQNQFQLQYSDIKEVIIYYNEFLLKLSDVETRNTLSKMNMHDIYKNKCFLELRSIADNLQECLNKIFITNPGPLSTLTLKYGIF